MKSRKDNSLMRVILKHQVDINYNIDKTLIDETIDITDL